MTDSHIVLVPHKILHGTISSLVQRLKLVANVVTMGAIETNSHSVPNAQLKAQQLRYWGVAGRANLPNLTRRVGDPCKFHQQQSMEDHRADWHSLSILVHIPLI